MNDVLTIGSVTTDTFIQADFLKTITDPKHLSHIGFRSGKAQCFSLGSKIEISNPIVTIGGGAYNSAVTFSRSGFKTASLFNIGDDNFGKNIISSAKKEKIFPLAIVDNKKNTGSSIILLDKNGERTILVYRGCSGQIERNEIPLSKLKAKWTYISPGSISLNVLKTIISKLHKNGSCIAINPSKDLIKSGISKIKPILNLCKVVILNREEASYLTGIPYQNSKEIFKKMDQYVKGLVLVTDGSKGATVSDGYVMWSVGTFKEKKVIDRTGAGDAFGSAFVAGLLDFECECLSGRCNIDAVAYSLKRASANATSVIEKIGANSGILTKKEFISNHRWNKLKINIKRT